MSCTPQDITNLNSLQVTMQPDGSFLCFGNSENQKESSSIELPTVDVSIWPKYNLLFECCIIPSSRISPAGLAYIELLPIAIK